MQGIGDRLPIPVVLKQSSKVKQLDLTSQGLGDDYLVALGHPIALRFNTLQ